MMKSSKSQVPSSKNWKEPGSKFSSHWKLAIIAIAMMTCAAGRAQPGVMWKTNVISEGDSVVSAAAEADHVRAIAMPLRKAKQKWNVAWPAGGGDHDLLLAMRRSISGLIAPAFADYHAGPTDADDAMPWMRGLAEQFNRDFKEMLKDDPGMAQRYEAIVDAGPAFTGSHVVVLKSSSYLYSGGAHGSQSDAYEVIGLAGKRVLKFDEVFPSNRIADLQHAMEIQFRRDKSAPAPTPLKDAGLFENTLAITSNYFADAAGIGFTYADYEIAPHSEGIITIHLTWDDVRELIAPGTALRAEADERAAKKAEAKP
jgi:hypothetical protein